MTKNEYRLIRFSRSFPEIIIAGDNYITSLEQRNTELEQRIKELQKPKTCDGCMFENAKYVNMCDECIRSDKIKDQYELKQN